jgi:hypothetical protein
MRPAQIGSATASAGRNDRARAVSQKVHDDVSVKRFASTMNSALAKPDRID